MEALDLMASQQLQDCASLRKKKKEKRKKEQQNNRKKSLHIDGNPSDFAHMTDM